MSDLFQDNGAELSKDRKHRYSLWRTWDKNKSRILFIGVNPSKADAIAQDKTISRCMKFADSWGYGGIYFGNLYSFRTPYMRGPLTPQQIAEGWSPLVDNLDIAIGEECNHYLKQMIADSDKVVCAWGSWDFEGFEERAKEVLSFIHRPYCLGVNADGQPKHPLYLKSTSRLLYYPIEEVEGDYSCGKCGWSGHCENCDLVLKDENEPDGDGHFECPECGSRQVGEITAEDFKQGTKLFGKHHPMFV